MKYEDKYLRERVLFDSESPSPVAPPTGAEFAADTLLLAGIAGAARAENRDAFAKVDAATEFHRR